MKNLFNYSLLALVIVSCAACTKSDSKGMVTPTGKGGSLARFTIVGKYLYIVDKNNLKVFDLSIASKPLLRNTTDVGFEIETIFPFKDRLFIGSTSVVHIFSIENPESPVKLGTAISPTVMRRCDPVVAKDSVAYATLRSSGICGGVQNILAVYNITNIHNPVQVNSMPVTEPYGLGYSDNALYVCDKSSLLIYDISLPFAPELKLQMKDSDYFDVIPYGATLVCWVQGGLILYDISERFNPQLIAKIN